MVDHKLLSRYKMVFMALLESAMRYREAYYRDEIELHAEMLTAAVDREIAGKQMTGTKERKVADKVRGMQLDFQMKMERFNVDMYKEIENLRKNFSEKADDTFDQYATGFGLIAEEYIKAKNTTDLLILARAYNEGLLDELIATIKENRENPKDVENVQAIQGDMPVSSEGTVDPKQEGGV